MRRPVTVAVLDHGMGNLRSVAKALEAAGASVSVTADADAIQGCDALCVPGQGIFGRCVEALGRRGLDDLIGAWLDDGRSFLGICLGMQVLFDSTDEDDAPGLGIFRGHVARLPSSVRVPHIGWNEVEPASPREPHPRLVERQYFYFDHSYAVQPTDHRIVSGWCDHGVRFAAAIEAAAAFGVQFHPEKSGAAGLDLLRRWITTIALQSDPTMERQA